MKRLINHHTSHRHSAVLLTAPLLQIDSRVAALLAVLMHCGDRAAKLAACVFCCNTVGVLLALLVCKIKQF